MTAQEMFKKLGYSYDYKYDDYIECEKYFVQTKVTMVIQFNVRDKEYFVFIIDKPNTMNLSINVNEHKAIHQQIKELGWLERDKPILIADEGFDADVSSHLCCPYCKQPIVNVWSNIEYKPRYCHYCGQAILWENDDGCNK